MERINHEREKKTERKVAIVTGASSGIGAAISRRLCRLGYEVFGFGRDFAKVDFSEAERFHPIVCDVLDTERLCALVKQIASEYPVHILVNRKNKINYLNNHNDIFLYLQLNVNNYAHLKLVMHN